MCQFLFQTVNHDSSLCLLLQMQSFYRGGYNMTVNKEKTTQILVTFTKEQVEQIENYWHENKLKNRNEAIRQLVEKGLSRK